MFTYSNTSLSLNSLLSDKVFTSHLWSAWPWRCNDISILFKFPASWWITSHRLLTSSTTSATFSALHGTHVKVPSNNDLVDLVLKFPASWWIISHCPFTPSTRPATFTALHGTQAFLLKIHQSGSIFLQQAITLLIIPFIRTLLFSLISFIFLFSSDSSQVT